MAAKRKKKSPWPASEVVTRKAEKLKPYEKNPRIHSDAQIEQLKKSIQQFGWTIPILIDPRNRVIAGHGRLEAAKRLNIEDVPCLVAKGWSEAQKRAYTIADNKLALESEWDSVLLVEELSDLATMEIDIDLTGFEAMNLDDLLDLAHNEAGGQSKDTPSALYTRKIDPPIYEVSGKCPEISELFNTEKSDELIARIKKAKLGDKALEALLIAAAHRHTSFRFDKLAEFYAHADAKTQRLFEDSAMVVIDFESAIERGFVKLSQRITDQWEKDHGEA